jgi:hypothetical protein
MYLPTYLHKSKKNKIIPTYFTSDNEPDGINNATHNIQRVTEISTLILTGNRTRQKEQLFYLPFCQKTMFNSKKKLERFFTKITIRH